MRQGAKFRTLNVQVYCALLHVDIESLTSVTRTHGLWEVVHIDWRSVGWSGLEVFLQTMSFTHCLHCGGLWEPLDGRNSYAYT